MLPCLNYAFCIVSSQCLLHNKLCTMHFMGTTPSDRLKQARIEAGYAEASDAARALGVNVQTYLVSRF
jgi:hypothetical protein